MRYKVLIADDESGVRELLKELLESEYDLLFATDGREALNILQKEEVHIALLDLRMPEMTGLQVMEQVHKEELPTVVIFITADKDIQSAIKAIKLGAFDYVVKPFDTDKIMVLVKNALEKFSLEQKIEELRHEVETQYSFESIIGASPEMQKIYQVLKKVLNNDSTVLIAGESGTGKELVAKAIHYSSHRKNGPFVAVDCAAIPETLIENELFGHEKGAFTGAMNKKIGKFELANKGTMFLDEIGNLRTEVQSKLLRVLQEREFERVGSNQKVKVDIRVIAATNADLDKKILDGSFREDLYYRLNVVNVKLPPLRQRQGDIVLLTRNFLEQYNKEFKKNVKISQEVMDIFLSYKWPGNVRELKNMIQRLVVITESNEITKDDLSGKLLQPESVGSDSGLVKVGMNMEDIEKVMIRETIKHAGNNLSKAARILGITRKTLHNKLERYPDLLEAVKAMKNGGMEEE